MSAFGQARNFADYGSSNCTNTEYRPYRIDIARKTGYAPNITGSDSRVRLFATPWAVDHQVPLSMGFPLQEYWSGLPFPPPGDLPYPGIEPMSSALQTYSLPAEPPGKPQQNM